MNTPRAGSNWPPFSMVFLNEASARLNEPSGSLFILVRSACKVTSLVVDILREGNTWIGDLLKLGLLSEVWCRELGLASDEKDLWNEMPLGLAALLKGLWLAFTRAMMSMSNP